jgi:spermidine/putrescine transport system ATP-binding protein
MDNSNMIAVQNVTKSYPLWFGFRRSPALKSISFEIERGKFYHIAGHLGSGKTSLARLLAGLGRPTSGVIQRQAIAGQSQCVGYMAEDMTLPLRMKVGEALRYFVGLRRGRSNAPQTLQLGVISKRLNLDHFENSVIESVPVGIRRRLQFAIAVAEAPHLVVLDEPSYSLDKVSHEESIAILRDLKIAGSTVVAFTGEADEFSELVDVRMILRNHELAYRSDRTDSKDRSRGPVHELELSGANFEMIQQLRDANQLPSPTSTRQSGFQQRLRFDDYEKALQWLNAAVASGIIVTRFEEISGESVRNLDELLAPDKQHG